MNEKNKVLVGEITSAHGIRGMVKVYPSTDTPERLTEIERIYLGDELSLRRIESSSVQKSMVLLKIEGIDDRNASERLRGVKLYIPIEDRKPLEEGQYFIEDLLNLAVYTIGNEYIGEVSDVMTQHVNDILVIRDGDKEHLIPFVRVFIKEVKEDRIVVDPIEGMLS